MRILLVLNKPNREMPIMEAIKREILDIDNKSLVEIKEMCTPEFNAFVYNFKPNVILTFPFTCVGFSTWYYLFKLLFKAKIISYRNEGLVDYNREFYIQLHVGFDKYGKGLVDYELFWGCKAANVIGARLAEQKKISSMKRIRYVGYPRLETYFSSDRRSQLLKLPSRIYEKINEYKKENILFSVTGFQYASYTKQDLFNAGDLDAENRCEELLKGVEVTRRFREDWIKSIIQASKYNPELLFIVKKHPLERKKDYDMLENFHNILYVYEDVEIQDILPFTGLFFHYGSTSVVDTYILRIPSIYVCPEYDENRFYTDLGWPSIKRIPVSQIPVVVKEYKSNQITFEMLPKIKHIMKEVFNIEEGKPYQPSREIAEIIMSSEPAQRIPLTDRYLWKAFASVFFQLSVRCTAKMIKKLFRIQPEVDLLQMLSKKLRG